MFVYRVVVLISGNGSNLQALIDAQSEKNGYELVGVISNNADAIGLERAQKAKIPTRVIVHQHYPDRSAFEEKLSETIQDFKPDCIALAGFMRILSAQFLDIFPDRIINIHPSLLPRYPGLHTHQRVLEAGDNIHGATLHYVNHDLDGGPIIAQTRVPVFSDDTIQSLSERVLKAEHVLYPQVLTLLAQNRLKFDGKIVTLDNKPVSPAHGFALILPTAQGSVS